MSEFDTKEIAESERLHEEHFEEKTKWKEMLLGVMLPGFFFIVLGIILLLKSLDSGLTPWGYFGLIVAVASSIFLGVIIQERFRVLKINVNGKHVRHE